MATVRGCDLPDELLYDVDNHIWFTEVGDGTVKLGMTARTKDDAVQELLSVPYFTDNMLIPAYFAETEADARAFTHGLAVEESFDGAVHGYLLGKVQGFKGSGFKGSRLRPEGFGAAGRVKV